MTTLTILRYSKLHLFRPSISASYSIRKARNFHNDKATSSDPFAPSSSVLSQIEGLAHGHQPFKEKQPEESTPQLKATWDFSIQRYDARDNAVDRWRRRDVLGTRRRNDAATELKSASVSSEPIGGVEALFTAQHKAYLNPPYQGNFKHERRLDFIQHQTMRSYVQVLTTPTADTPGTTLLLHFDNRRYLIGSLAEGTQRAAVQVGARLLKVSECFITGRTEWRNTGGLIGMILTLADGAASSAAASAEEGHKRALAKGKRLGVSQNEARMAELFEDAKRETSNKLVLFSAPNLNHTLATARRFVFRKGMPVDVHEIDKSSLRDEGVDQWEPYWADENIKVWAMSVLPTEPVASNVPPRVGTEGITNPRKRSIDEVYERSVPQANGTSTVTASSLTSAQRDQLTVKAVVADMFNSSWRLDTLHETALGDVRLPATMFVRNPTTNMLEKYTGPLPGQPVRPGQPAPDLKKIVLVRKPWPGALVESLPPTEPRKEAVSYIIRNHVQRGKFHPERAMALKVEKGKKWAHLAAGESVQSTDGKTITPDMVLGESKEGGGLAVIDLPEPIYIDNLLARPEWHEPKVMAGVGAMLWICGPDVARHHKVKAFMEQFSHIHHVVSGPEYCANAIALDSTAAATVRLRQIDPARYNVPVHESNASAPASELPRNARVAMRGQVIQLEPAMGVHEREATQPVNIAEVESETPEEVLVEARKAREGIMAAAPEMRRWAETLPKDARDAEIVTLGTGSALPSKYRNVSATLLRVPGWGSMLFDCGENTLGQLKRVFPADELRQIMRELRIIWISHMHADHHLGTVSVIRAWYEEVHGGKPQAPDVDRKASFDPKTGLAVISEPAMMSYLHEYSYVEDYGFSRIAPICITRASPFKTPPLTSKLGWFIPPTELSALPSDNARQRTLDNNIMQPGSLNLTDIQAVGVQHCHGARAVSFTFPSGFKASYSGDCRPSRAFSAIGKGSTVCIHEATFDDTMRGDAEAKNHSTTSEALGVAQAMGARTCVLTHFSQRYQKLPVLERGEAGSGGAVTDSLPTVGENTVEEESANPEDALSGPLEDVAATFPDQHTNGEGMEYDMSSRTKDEANRTATEPAAVNFKVTSDMKVCVAFDYMRVKVGEIPQLEKFTPALLKLFEEEAKVAEEEAKATTSNMVSSKAEKKQKLKGQRGNT
ncbi:hypothetical protein BAUCODRAFT_38329 [Baudoinia panamericana UAMH 10762]|uniref:ribonuclease Z n=1 Tax=Baudoinia panamericana (strain UAMH 10762) TaxID=717646 RepID=M2MLM7_BAUPA|nr:uncharacterized protein BAUCODRAFT_38329 [Baudoinia panamericana UAMH 10762]EMC92298.1 hypothetical protein BAUCODRAFT_38329 [Baudoinia panamericana UAMH 10762]